MSDETNQVAVERVTEQLETSEFADSVQLDIFKTRSPIAATALFETNSDNSPSITYIEARLAPPPPPRKLCSYERLMDLAGYGRTATDGSVTLRIGNFICGTLEIAGEDECWVVATPRSSEPAYLTHLVVAPTALPGPPPPDPNDIRIHFFAWGLTGQPKANVSFSWRALFHIRDDVIERA
jgi:hypothetical protein